MGLWVIIPVLLVATFFVVSTLLQRRSKGPGGMSAQKDPPFFREGTAASTGIAADEAWWKDISSLHQLQLALHLAEKAMPVWEKFTSLQVVSYRDASAGPSVTIESDLLQRTLEDLALHVQVHFSGDDSMKLHQHHTRFIGPVLALKDGTWVCSYPVKKIFLSVYFILMSVVEQHSQNTGKDFISEAINAALECMELSKLYTPEEIAAILKAYRVGL